MRTLIAGTTPALAYTRQYLLDAGIPVTDSFRWDVKHLLLDVPSFRPGGVDVDTVLTALPREITVWGGKLNHPTLEGYRCVDFLCDESYLLENAAITADCALALGESMISCPWNRRRTLIIGWGRIGKSLASKLREADSPVTVAARSESDRSRLKALGYQTVDLAQMAEQISVYDTIINTVPTMILTDSDMDGCDACLKLDLASNRGIAGQDVVWARGLPGKYAPERSGRLIADTFLRILKEERQ